MIEYIQEQLFLGNIERALEKINLVLRRGADEKTQIQLLGLKGIGLVHQGKMPEAIEHLSWALEVQPDAELKYWRSVAYLELACFQEALNDARLACELAQHNIDYEHHLLHLLQILGRDTEVIQKCDQLINQFGRNYLAIAVRAYAYLSLGRYNDALTDYEFLSQEGQMDEYSINNRGYCYDKLGDIRLAKQQYEYCLSINPYHPYALNNLGFLYCQQGKFKRGIRLIRSSIKYDPTNAYAYKNMGKALLLQGEKEEAYQMLEKAIALGYAEQYDDEVDRILQQEFDR